MKNLLSIILVIAFILPTKAQLTKGRHMLGFNINYFANKRSGYDSTGKIPLSNEKANTKNIGIRYGYMLTDKVLIGV